MATADRTITLDATLRADGTLQLDEPPDLPPGRVRVTIATATRSGRTREQIDAAVDALRDELEDGLRRADRARAGKDDGC